MVEDFRKRLKNRETVLGTMVTLPTPSVAEILANIGFDWLFIDGEHGPIETTELAGILQAVNNRSACIYRVPEAAEVPIKKALDLGADGIIVPQTNTPEQVADVVKWARYAPQGARGVGLARAHGYGMSFADYLSKANEQISVVVQAEHALAIENIEKTVQVEGIDAVLLGPYDLSASLGHTGELDHPSVTQAIDHLTETCLAAGIPLGVFGVTAGAMRPYIERGYTFIVAGVDTMLLGTSATKLLSDLRSPS